MGTPAKSSVNITCKNKKTSQHVLNWINTANHNQFTDKDEHLKGDYDINVNDIITGRNNQTFIDITIYSSRVKNLEWQLKNLSDYCKTFEDVIEFTSLAWMQIDSISWDK